MRESEDKSNFYIVIFKEPGQHLGMAFSVWTEDGIVMFYQMRDLFPSQNEEHMNNIYCYDLLRLGKITRTEYSDLIDLAIGNSDETTLACQMVINVYVNLTKKEQNDASRLPR